MKKLAVIVVGVVVGAFVNLKVTSVRERDALLKEIEANRAEIVQLKKRLDAHEADARKAMMIVCDDIGRVRFSVKAIANTLKFVEKK